MNPRHYLLSYKTFRTPFGIINYNTRRLVKTMGQHASYLLLVPWFYETFILIENSVYLKIRTLALVSRTNERTVYTSILFGLMM